MDVFRAWVSSVIEALIPLTMKQCPDCDCLYLREVFESKLRPVLEARQAEVFFGFGSDPEGFAPGKFAETLLFEATEIAHGRASPLSGSEYDAPMPILTDDTYYEDVIELTEWDLEEV